MLQQNPALTPDQVKATLMQTASKTFPQYSTYTDPTTGVTYNDQYDAFTVGAGVREVLIFGGFSSLLGFFSGCQRHFGWHLGLDFYFVVRGLGVLMFWIACWYLMALWMWSRTSQVLKRINARKP